MALENGPLHIIGTLELKDANVELLEKAEELFLCRCVNSKNKPYCDGQHEEHNFQEAGRFQQPLDSGKGLINEGILEIKIQTNGPIIL